MKNKTQTQTADASQNRVEEIPDSCLPPDDVLAQLGFEKIPTQGKPELPEAIQLDNIRLAKIATLQAHAEKLAEACKATKFALSLSYNGKKSAICDQIPELGAAYDELTSALADYEEARCGE